MDFTFRSHSCALGLWFLLLCSTPASAQSTETRSQDKRSASPDHNHALRRELWFAHGRVIPGQSAAALRYRAHLQKMQLRAARAEEAEQAGVRSLPQTSSTTAWTPLGPAPLASDATGYGGQDYGWVSGRATAVAVDPADRTGNTVYIGGAFGGVWKSTNAGPASSNPANVIWNPVTDNQATLAVGAIAIQPGNSDPAKSVILVGTGETNSSLDSYYGLGVLRSADAGNTWSLISQDASATHSFAGLGFSQIAFSATNPSLVVAAAAGATQGVIEGLEIPLNTNRGLYYSTDSGQSWNYANVQDGNAAIDPSSITSVVFNQGTGTFFAAVRWHGIYSSSDGVNWNRLSNQPGGLSTFVCPTNPASPNCPIYRGELAVVPGRNEMYGWYVDNSDDDEGIWRTTDGGNTWTQLDDSGITNCGDLLGGCGTSQGSYNLELAALPDGTATDLYAGAINLYKCTLTNGSPNCSGSGSNTFQNLTHAYGCPPDFGSIAHVHPSQHALDFMLVNNNTQDVMYFANDGGVYRALDGYSGLTSENCGASNQFDSLNQTLGSMTQFVSFSQHPNDPNTLLGGAQGNGSPATSSSQSGTSWLNVNSGDGGYNAIDPDNPTQWFTTNTDVSIQRCTLGVDCHAADFNNGLIVSNATVGGDSGALYTPYILDPQNSGELLVGTCRVWRGATDGTRFNLLTHNFETGGEASCSGSEVNLVRSLAAGGLKDTDGFSNVIYAGTDGFGPLVATGGHIWVTPNASKGAGDWFDRTGKTNPGHFPVSAVALDTSDKAGNTAYMTIMGFHVSHVWKTTNAGVSWSDFTGNLSDAPVNAVLVDSGTVYVGTDVGVFSSGTNKANWTEVGPAPGSGPGYLPNVPVTALRLFNSSGTTKLRASTYGRGIWEFTLVAGPDFEFALSNNPQTVFAGQTASFTGTLKALNGYNSAVNLSCATAVPPLPTSCLAKPNSLKPSTSGTAFTLNAGGAAGDYFFNAQGVGTDSNKITRVFSLALHVMDFNLTIPAPGSVALTQSATSGPVSVEVTAAGAFNESVVLSCRGLPAGAACNFQPSTVSPVAGAPASVTLTISTGANTPAGSSSITLNGSVTGGPTRTQNLGMTVAAPTQGNFTLATSNSPQTVGVTGTARFHGTVTSSGGYNSVVNLSCGGAAPPTCQALPPSVTPTAAGAPFTVTAGSESVQNFSFSIVGTGTDAAQTTHSAAVALNVAFDFALNNNTGAQSIQAGQKVPYQLDVRPLGSGNVFPANVTLSCSNLPPLTTCLFKPDQVSAGAGGDQNLVLTVQTTGATAPSRIAEGHRLALFTIGLGLPGLFLAALRRPARNKRAGQSTRRTRRVLLMVLVALAVLHISCGGGLKGGSGGGGDPGTPPGPYTITATAAMSAASGTQTRTARLALTVQ
jgi:hypothetical protein